MTYVMAALGYLALLVIFVILFAFPTMWAWNATLPHLFGTPTVDLGTAIWLNVLGGMLFKSYNTTTTSSK